MTDLERAFDRWQRSRADAEEARLRLLSAIRKAVEQGQSQSDVARILGWPRQRVQTALKD